MTKENKKEITNFFHELYKFEKLLMNFEYNNSKDYGSVMDDRNLLVEIIKNYKENVNIKD
jgi:hypothetical protein